MPAFDYDDNSEPNPYRFRVTAKVEGDLQRQGHTDVLVNITPVDEDLIIKHVENDNAEVPGHGPYLRLILTAPAYAAIEFAERKVDGTPNDGVVATFLAEDPERRPVNWDLRGADAALFTISSSGELKFREVPNFEDPQDQAAGTGAKR